MSQLDLFKTPPSTRYHERSGILPFDLIMLIEKVIQELSQMAYVSNSVQTDVTKNIFNMLGEEKQKNNLQEDPHTKLRNLQNKSELNRASVELMVQRRPKRSSVRLQKEWESNEQESYRHIYQDFKNEQNIKPHLESELNSEEDDNPQFHQEKSKTGIKHYSLLKQHPKLLNFTLQKLKEKNREDKQRSRKEEEQVKIKNGSRLKDFQTSQDYKQILLTSRKSQLDILQSPKAIVDNQLKKFYSKSSKGKIDIKIRQNPRCNYFLMRQDRIMSVAQQKHVSKQNIKKLKQRLNQIVNQMHHDDRKSRELLPKIHER